MVVIVGLSLVSWGLYRYYNEQYYKQFHQYTGKAKIDDYEIIADGAGAIVHWTSTTPDEDKKNGRVWELRICTKYSCRFSIYIASEYEIKRYSLLFTGAAN